MREENLSAGRKWVVSSHIFLPKLCFIGIANSFSCIRHGVSLTSTFYELWCLHVRNSNVFRVTSDLNSNVSSLVNVIFLEEINALLFLYHHSQVQSPGWAKTSFTICLHFFLSFPEKHFFTPECQLTHHNNPTNVSEISLSFERQIFRYINTMAYAIQRFNSAFTRVLQYSISWKESIQFLKLTSISLRYSYRINFNLPFFHRSSI